jgi:transposase
LAILAGKHDPQKLAELPDKRVKATEAVIAKSLVGDYGPEHLFALDQSLTANLSYQKMMEECDRQIRLRLEDVETTDVSPTPPEASPAAKRSAPVSLREELNRVFGVNLTRIPGIQLGIAQKLFGEIVPDLSKFRSASSLCLLENGLRRRTASDCCITVAPPRLLAIIRTRDTGQAIDADKNS